MNGRSAPAAAGFAGNFHLDEAIGLCRAAKIPAMIAHHYGLFAFNTADPAAIDAAARTSGPVSVHRARLGVDYALRPC